MIGSIIIQFIFIALIIGGLGLIPLLILNRKSAKIDNSMHKKNFDASKDLSNYKTREHEVEIEPDMEKKLNSFKIKD
jgi:hypothetical protein